MSDPLASSTPRRAGLAFAIGAYGLWGILPIFFLALAPSGPIEIVAWRIVFSLVFCALLITVIRGWSALWAIVRDRRLLLTMGLAGGLIVVNWTTYVYGTMTGHVVETALGYFINPVVTVLLGVFVLGERLRPLQWASVATVAVAVLVITIGYGSLPWISLVLAASFAVYGLVKKTVGGRVDAISGLTLETAWLTPLAGIALVVMGATGTITFGTVSPVHTLLLLSTGVITAVPLLFFAAAARRLPLTWIGLTQYLAPLLQFAFGVFVLREDMPPERWVGFGLVWAAILLLTIDMFRAGHTRRASRPHR